MNKEIETVKLESKPIEFDYGRFYIMYYLAILNGVSLMCSIYYGMRYYFFDINLEWLIISVIICVLTLPPLKSNIRKVEQMRMRLK